MILSIYAQLENDGRQALLLLCVLWLAFGAAG